MRPVVITSVGLLASSGVWTAMLAAAAPRDDGAVILMAASLWALAAVSVVGMVVARARWARRLGLATAAGHGAVAVLISPGIWWGAGVILSALSAIALGGPWLDGYIRGRPSAAGPPTRAVLLPLLLVGTPFILGLVGAGRLPGLILAASAWLAAFWFIRTMPGALVVVRGVWPLVALGLSIWLGWPEGLAGVTPAVAVAVLAWHPSVRIAVHPLVERGSVVAIPPELAPREILDAAGLDDRGRRR